MIKQLCTTQLLIDSRYDMIFQMYTHFLLKINTVSTSY